jgi:hypothetical protein
VRYLLALSLAQVDAFGAARAPWEETTVRKAAAARHLCRAARDLRGAGTDDARRVLAAMRVAVTYVLRYPGYAPFRSALEAALGGGGTRIGPRGVGEDGDRRTDRAPGSPAGAPCHRRGATGDPASRNRRRG